MNTNTIAKNYPALTPEERFRLILAASGRGDEVERERLASAGGRITLTMQDHAPYAHAFEEVALLVFIEMLEEAARYRDAFHRAGEVRDFFGDDDDEGEEVEADGGEESDEGERKDDRGPSEGDRRKKPAWQRSLDLAYAAGFVFRTKVEGWSLFCGRLSIPPFLVWEGLPGINRLRSALDLARDAAFAREGFLRWLNDVRPAGEPELTDYPLTAEAVADETEKLFQARVEWWSG
jgi:hypothetical protein